MSSGADSNNYYWYEDYFNHNDTTNHSLHYLSVYDNYYYNYDYDGSQLDQYTIPLKDILPVAVFYALVFLLGMVGNLLVIFCIAKYKRMQSITNQLLLSLACADFLLTLACVPIKFAELFSYGWTMGLFLCKFTSYIQTMTMITSVMTLTAISMERYYAIAKPLRAKYICTTNHARGVIIAIWTLAIVFSTPTLFVQKHYKIGLNIQVPWCNRMWHTNDPFADNTNYHKALVIAYDVYMLFLLFLVPVFIMVFAYCGVCIELWVVTKPTTAAASPSSKALCEGNTFVFDDGASTLPRIRSVHSFNESKEMPAFSKIHRRENQIRRRVLNMLVTVVAIFICCWAPLLCYNLVVSTEVVKPYLPKSFPYAKNLNTTFSLMAYTNSCINPLIYGFMSRYFRKSFKQALSVCCLVKGSRYSQNNSPIANDNKTSSMRHNVDKLASSKRTTLSTGVESGSLLRNTADSSLSRSPPNSPT